MPSIQSSLLNIKWHGSLSRHHEARMEVMAVVRKRGREKKSQKRGIMQGVLSSNVRSAHCEIIIIFKVSREP
jgi:hypothetical protein